MPEVRRQPLDLNDRRGGIGRRVAAFHLVEARGRHVGVELADSGDDLHVDQAVGRDAGLDGQRDAPAEEDLLREHQLVLSGNGLKLRGDVEGVGSVRRVARCLHADIRELSRHVHTRFFAVGDDDFWIGENLHVVHLLKRAHGQAEVVHRKLSGETARVTPGHIQIAAVE